MKTPKAPTVDLKPADPDEADAILSAIENFDLSSSPWWSDLDELSSRTMLEALEANPGGIFRGPAGTFEAVGSVYVTLHYGDKRDSASMPDSFPARFIGSINPDTGDVTIEDVQIDTSSFFG